MPRSVSGRRTFDPRPAYSWLTNPRPTSARIVE